MAIKFSLICECSAKFEGWFPGNKEYEQQVKTGKLMCPMCDSTNVRKDIMAPSVKRKSKQIKGKGQGNLMMSGRARQILQTIEIIKDKIRISEEEKKRIKKMGIGN